MIPATAPRPGRRSAFFTHSAAFLFPVALVVFAMWRARMYPFGPQSILVWDLKLQYVDFFGWLQNVIKGDANVFYSAGKSIGGNMWGVFSYYLSSPLNILFAFFPKAAFNQAVTLLTLLKFGLCGLTCSFFLQYRFSLRPAFVTALSACYALMQFTVGQASNIMWLEGVIMLPLIMLGIARLVREGKAVLLYISLVAGICINWYNGYMICLFSLLYYWYEETLYQNFRLRHNGGPLVGRFLRFAAIGLLAAGGSAFQLLPTVKAMLAGKGEVEPRWWEPNFRLPMLDALKGVFFGNSGSESMPAIYCGMLVTLLCVLFFLNRSISKKEKTVTGFFIGFMFLSMCFYPLERIWNGMRSVYSYYCRFVFLVSFLLIVTAARSLSAIRALTTRNLLSGFGILAALGLFFHSIKGFDNAFFAYLGILLTGVFAALLFYLIRYADNPRRARVLSVVCVGVLLLELAANTQSRFRAIYKWAVSHDYVSYTLQSQEQLAELYEADPSLYRVEKTYNRYTEYDNPVKSTPVTDEALSIGYRGLSHYSSAYDSAVCQFFIDLGYCRDDEITITYNEPILLSDSLLGVKYVSSLNCPPGFVPTGYFSTSRGESFYRNPYALPVGYAADAQVLTPPEREDDPFAYQNAFISAILGEETACFKPVPVQVEETEEGSGALAWTAEIPANLPVYGYISSTALKNETDLYIDDVLIRRYFSWFSDGIFHLDSSEENRVASIRIDNTVTAWADYTCFVYYLDMPVFEDAIRRLREVGFEPEEFRDGYISGQYQAAQDGYLLLTVPAADGWTIEVNGETVEPETAWNALMALPVKAGANTVTLSYISPGFKPGVLISLVSVGLAILFLALNHRRRRNRDTGSE